ncbi:hypothetical protein [Chryseolinea lacunae]|uniref:Initiator Rep protein domain-containing protein n=1 Tax=Chryseolinea lacunae TaxID=2801331 RepID=A0ABS1KMR5_9BACT|nr:hypothetical protein [Chryseolinea lacunae]MBL0740537.1 hypothetical protein [Chryseolinea lacunae]
MKVIRIANDVKHLEEADQNVTLFRIQEILSEHRSNLINRILNDLTTYLEFKFYLKVDNHHKYIIREKLLDLAASKISLATYSAIVKEIQNTTTYHVPAKNFFQEIDTLLDAQLNPAQLHLIT